MEGVIRQWLTRCIYRSLNKPLALFTVLQYGFTGVPRRANALES